MLNYIEILKGARALIKSGRESYICSAISCIEASYNADRLREWIHKMLGQRHETLGSWMYEHEKEYRKAMSSRRIFSEKSFKQRDLVAKKLRKTRLAWIDWMIEEIKRNGGRIPT